MLSHTSLASIYGCHLLSIEEASAGPDIALAIYSHAEALEWGLMPVKGSVGEGGGFGDRGGMDQWGSSKAEYSAVAVSHSLYASSLRHQVCQGETRSSGYFAIEYCLTKGLSCA